MGLVKGFLFLGYVVLGLIAAYSTRQKGDNSRLVNLYIVYTLALGLGVGLTQRHDVWPFTTWPLVASLVPPIVTHPRIVALDGDCREYPIDYRALGPLEYDELLAWIGTYFPRLDRAAQDRAAAYLLGIIERSREQWLAGKPVLHFERYWRSLSAPLFLGHPEHWTQGEGVPVRPLRGLRVYNESWNVEERWRDPSKVTRRLAYEYREP
jgi:hypothetical protein